MGDKGIVFKNRVGLYEKELQHATDDFISAMLALDSAELNVRAAHRNLDIAANNAINQGLTGTNQQIRDAQLAVITTGERNDVNEAERILLITRHKLDIVSAILVQTKLEMQFITAAMNGGFVVSCMPNKALDEEAINFAEKFKS